MRKPIGFVIRTPVLDYKTHILPRLRSIEEQAQERLRAGDRKGALALIDAAMKEYPSHPYLRINEQLALFRTRTQNAGAGLRPNLYLTDRHAPGGGAAVDFDFKALGRYAVKSVTPKKWHSRWFKPEQNGMEGREPENKNA
ncbi:MAG: hypothetical protein KGH63_04450 [Candidatus Micrarchaeota archaeon]|nr:hypothetical protein [Candidatus Micrarchaeota archaeon]